ncbi:MAG: VWA domain-containing protein [Bryobacteraceae bacterium]|jgi:VWFA-related protein
MATLTGLAGALVLALGAQDSPQQPPINTGTVIRTETRQVLVDAVVTDKKNNYVRDLTVKDFKVLEDNKEQTIQSFSYEAGPASPSGQQQRYLVLFFDNSTMNYGDQARARDAAAKFIAKNAGPNRLMAIVNFGGSVQIAQNFTADADRLAEVVKGVKFSAVSPGAGAGIGGLNRAASDFGARTLLLGVRTLARNLADVPGRKSLILFSAGFPLTIEAQSELTAAIDMCNKSNVAVYPIDVRGLVAQPSFNPGMHMELRPPLSVGGGFSNGFLPQVRGGTGGTSGTSPGTSPSTGRTGTTTTGTTGNPGRTVAAPGTSTSTGRSSTGGGNTVNPNLNPNFNPMRQPRNIVPPFPPLASTNQQVLYMLADGTGGFVIVNTNDLLSGLDKIGKEQNEYYLIGYAPPDTEEGSCHALKVKMAHSYTVRARTGYCNVKQVDLLAGKPAEKNLETRAAANVPGTIQASMLAPFFYASNNAARVDVALEVPSASIKFDKVKGKMHAEIDILAVASKADGAVAARFSDSVKIDFPDKKDLEAFTEHPYHYDNQFDVAPGAYTLKVVFSSGGEEFGKLEAPLKIEAYDGKALFISGVALSKEFHRASAQNADLDTVLLEGRAPLVAQNMEIVPAGTNRFAKTDRAVCYLEIYEPLMAPVSVPEPKEEGAAATPADPAKPAAAPVSQGPRIGLQLRVIDRKSGDTKGDSGMVEVTNSVRPGNPVVPIALNLPLDKLEAGTYRAELKAVDSAGRSVTRVVDFEVL